MPDVFISHTQADREFVEELTHDLRKSGLTVSSASEQVAVGQIWPNVVEKAIRDSRNFLVVVSEKSHDSDWVLAETAFALAQGEKQVIPIVASKTAVVPFMLRSIRGLDLSDKSSYADSIDKLVSTLQSKDFARESEIEKDVETRLLITKLEAHALEREKLLLEAEAKLRAESHTTRTAFVASIFSLVGALLILTIVPDYQFLLLSTLGGVAFGALGSWFFYWRRKPRKDVEAEN